MRVALACDHGGLPLKRAVKEALAAVPCEVIDLGTDSPESVDYPDFAHHAVELLLNDECDRIVLICGTGIGMSVCANRFRGVRGALCSEPYTARMSRMHNDANCLILGGRVIGPGIAAEIVDVWMRTPFEGGRHAARLAKIDGLPEKSKDPSNR